MDFNYENDEEEEDDYLGCYDLKKGYGGDLPTKDMSLPPIFSYLHIDIGKTDFHFHRPEFDGKDRLTYFEKLKSYSNKSLDDLVNKSHHTEHFKLNTSLKGNDIQLVADLFDKTITDENCPVIGHFALYTTPATPEEIEAGTVQSPRIYFLLDANSVFHILFYDPFHQIHSMGKQTLESLKKQG